MSKIIDAVYENGVFRPLEPVMLPEGERVQVTVPEMSAEARWRLDALDDFDAEFEDLSVEQWLLYEESVERRPWFGDRQLDI